MPSTSLNFYDIENSRYELRKDLVSLLIRSFTLQSQGLTDSWSFYPLFDDWTSVNPCDVPFGARLWTGCDVFFFSKPPIAIPRQGLLEMLAESLETRLPTRFLLILPGRITAISIPKDCNWTQVVLCLTTT